MKEDIVKRSDDLDKKMVEFVANYTRRRVVDSLLTGIIILIMCFGTVLVLGQMTIISQQQTILTHINK